MTSMSSALRGRVRPCLVFGPKKKPRLGLSPIRNGDRLTASSGWQLPIASPDPNLHNLEEFLDHLTKLESILASNVIEWATANTGDAYARLSRLADEVGRIDSQRRDRP
jgi:hypothetical protein